MKSVNWLAPLTVRRFKTPTGPLADVDSGYVYDFSKQRAIMPHQIGPREHRQITMNQGGEASQALLTTPDTHGVADQFPFPK